jgi:hypothetical protein
VWLESGFAENSTLHSSIRCLRLVVESSTLFLVTVVLLSNTFTILGLFNIFHRIEPQKDLVSIYKICKIIFLTLWVLFPLEGGLCVFASLLLTGDVTHPPITFILRCLRLGGK